jgi:hypothetical protein
LFEDGAITSGKGKFQRDEGVELFAIEKKRFSAKTLRYCDCM